MGTFGRISWKDKRSECSIPDGRGFPGNVLCSVEVTIILQS